MEINSSFAILRILGFLLQTSFSNAIVILHTPAGYKKEGLSVPTAQASMEDFLGYPMAFKQG